jgi:hypothetical protein
LYKSVFTRTDVRRALITCLAATALATTLAACGGSSSSNSSASATGSRFQARVNLAKCARAHGINVPDPSPGGGAGAGIGRVLRQYSQAQVNTALQACRPYLAKAFPQFNLTPAQRAQVQQQLVKFAQCMRSHGVNVPDPTFNGSGSGRGFGFGGGFRSIDRNSPAFQSALKACQSLRPRFGRGAGGGGGPGSGGGPGGGAPAAGAPGA